MGQAVMTRTGIDAILEINDRHSKEFNDPIAKKKRQDYRLKHPTEICALKCMDGRLHLPIITQTPLGIIQPFRNIGGRFDLGWHGFQQAIDETVEYALVDRGRPCLVFVTYHYSRSSAHRGCRGHNYCRDTAMVCARNLKLQFEVVYGDEVRSVLCGIETDFESLILHGEQGEVVDLATIADSSVDFIQSMLVQLYPNMPRRILMDMIPLIQGNIRWSAKIQAEARKDGEIDHKEWVLGIGRGFDWLHNINTALIIGPFDAHLQQTIEAAAGILLDNLSRIDPPLVLMTSAPYREHNHEKRRGHSRKLAIEKAKFLNKYALDIISSNEKLHPLLPHLQSLTACVDVNTRILEVIERRDSVLN